MKGDCESKVNHVLHMQLIKPKLYKVAYNLLLVIILMTYICGAFSRSHV